MNNYIDTNLIISEFSWRSGSSQNILEPYLKLLNTDTVSLVDIPLIGYRFEWKLSKERVCTGYVFGDSYKPCRKEYSQLSDTDIMCLDCEFRQGFKQYLISKEITNEEVRAYLAKPHLVYLALFANNRIKVGTASELREKVRLVEQDALAYGFIARTKDAKKAMELESFISKAFSITESVTSRTKFKNLSNKLAPNSKSKFENTFQEIKKSKIGNLLIENPKFVRTEEIAKFYFPESKHELVKEDILFGQFEGLRGRYLLIKNDNQKVAFDIRNLVGKKIIGYSKSHNYDIHEDEQLSLL